MDDTRREFLIRMARAAAYAAPVVVTLSAPEGLAAQKTASTKGGGVTKSTVTDFSTNLDAPSPTTATAPWAVAPPGSSGPPGGE